MIKSVARYIVLLMMLAFVLFTTLGCATLRGKMALAPYSDPPSKRDSPMFWLKYQWRY